MNLTVGYLYTEFRNVLRDVAQFVLFLKCKNVLLFGYYGTCNIIKDEIICGAIYIQGKK